MTEGAGSATRDRPPFSYLLVHSPLVGPRSWEPVAAVLTSREVPVAVPSLLAALTATENRHDALAAAAAAVSGLPAEPWLVVVHSGAGALVPHPNSWRPCETWSAPTACCPPWHTWFGPEALAELVPDATLRAHVIADVPRVPLAYLEAVAPLHSGWEALPCGYLHLSEAYVGEEAEAERRGWATATLEGHHLSAVTDPAVVAEAILDLAARLVT